MHRGGTRCRVDIRRTVGAVINQQTEQLASVSDVLVPLNSTEKRANQQDCYMEFDNMSIWRAIVRQKLSKLFDITIESEIFNFVPC